jgi:putative PIN family toxin of toxin-antitoxin system
VRVLLDTNVLISAILSAGPPRALLEAVLRGGSEIVTSPFLLGELEEILRRKAGFSAEAAQATRSDLESLAHVVEPDSIPEVCRDEDDNNVLAAALQGEARYIVTGDGDLLTLGSYLGITILPPARYLAEVPPE